ncbi:uncharacterized protein L3040_004424 [Drepanopeziza brunnea f. sp. 'multigermtubi']|uniref:Spo12-like protein n=1 Tax=Marssonina brunnea f. sp. multigermtubi (strain MB_m1) TaxID=1072389 RepID=K1XYG7_MARBU|nr:spo12-like protein [Drepanopeziza brunnea f. sp. 'multigermtubi' MB_m1]EKD17884.1 spo12-like protein [Drepanopeziza brunnea f. sp. 'multigermtubi' MB_m1]KAJ5043036.1 hypothetical protein L3040_004424 [Drepanopeziza brunnea f. sp. 'multigermtubi']
MSSNVLADRDINASAATKIPEYKPNQEKGDVKSMEYHRQVLQSKLEESQGKQTYISPSDNIMSPCTAKLSAYRSKQVGKAKPKSLFAKTSSKNLSVGAGASGGGLFASKPVPNANTDGEDEKMEGQ